jgi:uncharacterized repeat protein (TIGR01451 family)
MTQARSSIRAILVSLPLLLAGGLSLAQSTPPMVCDADNNGVIDSRDIALITAARNTAASGPTDPRDPNHDGIINVLDARFCATICTLPNCAKAPAIPAPVASAGADQQVAVGATVELNGSASSSARGDALSYQWTLASVPPGSRAVLANPTAVRPTFVADLAGLYDIELVVTDAHAVASEQASVLVAAGSSTVPPVAQAGTYPVATVGGRVTLDATQSTSVSGAPLIDTWQFLEVPSNSTASLSNVGALNPTFTTDLYGQYYLKLTVLDSNYNSASADVTIDTQSRSPQAPTANAGPAQFAALGQVVALNGSASSAPSGETISAYQWVLLSKPAGSNAQIASPAAVTSDVTIDLPGDYVAQLIVTAAGAASPPATVLISTRDVPPTANAGSTQSVYVGDTVFLHGSAVAPDGNPLSYRWSIVDSPLGFTPVPLSGGNTATPNFVATNAGAYVAQLIVNNEHVDSAPSIAVVQATTPTTADLALTQSSSNATPVVGGSVQFTVTVSDLGPLNSTSASVTDLLPAGLTLSGAVTSQGAYNSATGVWSVGPISKGGSARLILTAVPSATGSFTNTAVITASAPTDPNAANNSASLSISVQQAANLTVVTTVDNATPLVGANVTFTTTVTNNGPAAAIGAQVADLLPSGFKFVSAQTVSGTYSNPTGVWSIGALAAGSSARLSITATVLATGSYTDTATVNASNSPNSGASITSTVSVTPRSPPIVSISSSAAGAKLVTPATVALTVSASSASALVATLTVYDGTTVIQSVPVNSPAISFSITLNNVAPGTHSYTAIATDSQGLTATSNTVTVVVVAPTATASLIFPFNNAFFVAPATVTLLASASSSTGTVTQVQFLQNGVPVGTASKAPYSVTLNGLAAGTYSFAVQVTDSTSTVGSSTVTVTVGTASSLSVTTPTNGAAIADDLINIVSGTVQAPPNSSITVNGQPADITAQGNFYVSNVGLVPGANTIPVVLTDPSGNVTTQSITVTSTGTQPFQASTNLTGPFGQTSGLAPLRVEFTVFDPANAPATSATVSCTNNGNADYTVAPLNTSGDQNSIGVCVYTTPGVYTALVSVINAPAGQAAQTVYTNTITVVVDDPVALDAVLRSNWSGMNNELLAGNQTQALSYLDLPAQGIYAPVFTGLAAQMPLIVSGYSDLNQGLVNNLVAEYWLTQNINGVQQGFFIYFVNVGGVWQIDAM